MNEKKEYQITASPAISQKQFLCIMQKTPKEHIYSRPAKGGGKWDYVTGVYIKKVLNYTFGWNWSFEIKDKIINDNQVIVLGKLSCKAENGDVIIKEQWGRADIKYKKQYKPTDERVPLDLGNDLKGATTDALKKCASELGIASDIYGKEEFKEIKKESFLEEENEGYFLTDEEKEKINTSNDLEWLGVICQELLKEKGVKYQKAILAQYNIKKAELESEGK